MVSKNLPRAPIKDEIFQETNYSGQKSMLKTLLFDVGGTLLTRGEWKDAACEALFCELKRQQRPISMSEFRTAFERALTDYTEEKARDARMHSGTEFMISRLCERLDIRFDAEDHEKALYAIEAQRLAHTSMVDGASEVLHNLSKKYTLYVVSRGDGRIVRSTLKHFGIDRYFKELFITEEMNADKETGSLFLALIEKAKINPKESLMIGNETAADGKCMGYGIPFCLVDKSNKNTNANYTFAIRNLKTLDGVLKMFDEDVTILCKLCDKNEVTNAMLCPDCKNSIIAGIATNPHKKALLESVSAFLGQRNSDVLEKIMVGPLLVRSDWIRRWPVTTTEIDSFYRNNRNYIYDLSLAHLTDYWIAQDCEIRDYALDAGYHDVLDFGCGLAVSSMMLAENGCNTTCIDMSKQLLDYVKSTAGRKGVKVIASSSFADGLQFDYIICADVLEHLANPEDTLESLLGLIKNGGAIALTTRFFKESDVLHPMHLAANESGDKDVARYMNKSGFKIDKTGTRGLQIWKKIK